MSFSNGFTVLAWVKPQGPMFKNKDLSDENILSIQKQLLLDFCTLISVRWNMEVTLHHINGIPYAYGKNSRFVVSDRTINNAIGGLINHVEFLKGSTEHTLEDLERYKQCKEKWNVPDQVTESTSGWDPQEQAGTSTAMKRKRF